MTEHTTAELVRSLELMREELGGRMAAPEVEVLERCIRAALRAVETDGRR